MSPRVAGAALALLAAVMLVASVAGIPTNWWAGHPLRNGEAMHKKDIDVSLLSAVGCNTGGDGTCSQLEMSASFDTVRTIELGASGILVLACLLLAGVTLAESERRKLLGLMVIGLAVACAGLAGALIFMPKMKATGIELPLSLHGIGVFFGGIACAVLGSVLAMRPKPKLELQPPRQSFAALAPPPTAQPVDVLAMLLEPSPPAPAPPAPDPVQGRSPRSPGGQLAGPAGPLAPPFAPFTPRPGGPPLATPPPSDARARSNTGGPPPMPGPDRSRSPSQAPDRFKASGTAPALPGSDRAKSASMPPPISDERAKSASIAPANPEPRTKAASVAPPGADARTKAASIPPPGPGSRPKGTSVPPPSAEQRMKSPSRASGPAIPSTVAGLIPPPRTQPATGGPPPRGKQPSAPPPTAQRSTSVAAVVPPPAFPMAPILPAMLPIRAVTDPGDDRETMDREAMTIARDAPSGGPIGDSTDASFGLPEGVAVEEHTEIAAPPSPSRLPPMEPRDSASDIQTSLQRKLTPSELMDTVARESQSEIETIAREKLSARDLAIGDMTSPGTAAPTSGIPASTAPESLPPPKPDEVAASGPTPGCPQCEAPMAWVEEHLRFYCKSCRMYF